MKPILTTLALASFGMTPLMAGNTALLKHASNVPRCAIAIEEVFRQAGATDHLFQNLCITSSAVADVVRHPAVRAVTLTGSTNAGRSVAACAGSSARLTNSLGSLLRS